MNRGSWERGRQSAQAHLQEVAIAQPQLVGGPEAGRQARSARFLKQVVNPYSYVSYLDLIAVSWFHFLKKYFYSEM